MNHTLILASAVARTQKQTTKNLPHEKLKKLVRIF